MVFENEQDMLTRVIAEVPFVELDCQFVNIEQGCSNTSFQLKSGTERYFIKFFDSDNFVLRDRSALFELQHQIAQLDWAIAPVFLSDDASFQIDRWYQGDNLEQAQLSKKKKIELTAQLLAALHTLEIDCEPLALIDDWQQYAQSIEDLDADSLENQIHSASDIYSKSNENIFCHNDLSFCNVLHSAPVMACDWEYAARGNRFFDIASCMLTNALSNEEKPYFIEHYVRHWKTLKPQHTLTLSECAHLVKQIQPVVELTHSLWFQAQKEHNQTLYRFN